MRGGAPLYFPGAPFFTGRFLYGFGHAGPGSGVGRHDEAGDEPPPAPIS